MARPAGDSEKRLLAAAKALILERGFHGLSVRAIAAKAGVNLGLVSYHFGGRERLIKRASQEAYEEFLSGLQLQVEEGGDPLENLRRVLLALGRFITRHRAFLMVMLRDLIAGNAEARRFATSNAPRHVVLVLGLVRECMRRGRLKRRPLTTIAPLMIGAVAVPVGMSYAVEEAGPRLPFDLKRKAVMALLLSDKALEERVDLVLKALAA